MTTYIDRVLAGAWSEMAVYDPVTMMAIGLGGTLLGTGISALGSIAGGNAQKQAGQMAATASLTSSRMASDAAIGSSSIASTTALTSSDMAATAARNSSQLTATAQEQGGEFASQEAGFEAEQLEQNAGNVRAGAQRQALDTTLSTKMATSTLVARAAGSGLAATGSTPIALVGQLGARGAYMSLSQMAVGENTARGMEDEATAAEISGAATKYGLDLQAEATRYGGAATSAADIYGGQAESVADLYSGKTQSEAALFGGESTAQADIMGGDAAQTASLYSAGGTVASGVGSAFSRYGMMNYPTATGRAGASMGN